MIRSVPIQETVYELQPVKDCHGETKLEEKPRVVWRGKNIIVIPPASMLLQYSPLQSLRLAR